MVVSKKRERIERTEEALKCAHYWIIQPAVGPISSGACQKCGEVKEFKNSIDYETEWRIRTSNARRKGSSKNESLKGPSADFELEDPNDMIFKDGGELEELDPQEEGYNE